MVFKCKMCGGDIVPIENTNTGKCLYCKSVMTLPALDSEKIVNLYNRANNLRLSNEFDKAYGVYETILEIDNQQIEAHWGLILCKYGVEYVDDPKTNTKVPTCHRTIIDSIKDDSDYKYIIKNAYGDALELYKKEASQIGKIQKKILEISAKEKPYDIFICYKETNKNKQRTKDSVIAEEIYDKLTQQNYKVFFARRTLENKLGTEFEPYIFSALNSAKIMIVVGTSVDNLESVWVKNEWSRYLELTKKNKNKTIIPVYSQIDAYELPESFAMLQSLNIDKIGAMQDLVVGINKIMEKSGKDEADYDSKVQSILEGATNIGDDKYEITVIKESISIGHYLLTLFFLATITIIKIIMSVDCFANTTPQLFFFKDSVGYMQFPIIVVIQVISLLFLLINCILKMGRRKVNKFSAIPLFGILILDIATIFITIHNYYFISSLFILTFILEIILYFINPSWYINASRKIIVDKDNKNAILAKNDNIKKNFTSKDKHLIKIRYYFLGIAILFLIGFLTVVPIIFSDNSNSRDENAMQIEITNNYIPLKDKKILKNDNYKDNNYILGIAKKGEIYTILDTKITKGTIWYLIKQKNGKEGLINDTGDNLKFLFNRSNKRDKTVRQLKIVNDYIRIRMDSTLYSAVLGNVYKGNIFTIIDTEENEYTWYKIKTQDNITGYIIGGYDGIPYVEVLESSDNNDF